MLSTHPKMIQFLLIYLTIMIMIFVRLGWENVYLKRYNYLRPGHWLENASQSLTMKKVFDKIQRGISTLSQLWCEVQKLYFPYMTGLWNNLNVSTQLMALPDFKEAVKEELKLIKCKHFSRWSKLGNTLLTTIRYCQEISLIFYQFLM